MEQKAALIPKVPVCVNNSKSVIFSAAFCIHHEVGHMQGKLPKAGAVVGVGHSSVRSRSAVAPDMQPTMMLQTTCSFNKKHESIPKPASATKSPFTDPIVSISSVNDGKWTKCYQW